MARNTGTTPTGSMITSRVTKLLARKKLSTGIGVRLRRSHASSRAVLRVGHHMSIETQGSPALARNGHWLLEAVRMTGALARARAAVTPLSGVQIRRRMAAAYRSPARGGAAAGGEC